MIDDEYDDSVVGTLQGINLSTLLSNIMLNELEKEMVKRGLKVNMTKSKVDRPSGHKYLGFGFYFDSGAYHYKAKPHTKSVAKFKKRKREPTCRMGRSLTMKFCIRISEESN